MKQKGFAHILVLILVVAGIGTLGYYSWQKGLIRTTPKIDTSPTPSEIETQNWKTYNTTLFSFKYPPEMTVGFSSSRNNISITGPTNEKDKEHFFGFKRIAGKGTKVGQIKETEIDGKTAFTRKIFHSFPPDSLEISDTEIVIENVRFHNNGDWFDNGVLYLDVYVDGNEVKAGELTDLIISTIRFNHFDDAQELLSLRLNGLKFQIPNTWWYEYGENNTFNNEWFDIDPETNAQPDERPVRFTLNFEPKKTDLNDELKRIREHTGNIILGVEKITISDTDGVIITSQIPSGPCNNCRWGSGTKLKETVFVFPEGVYSFYGDVTGHDEEFYQILSTFKFTE